MNSKSKEKDYYLILKIDQDASACDVKSAYKKLVMRYHPDSSSDDKNIDKFYDVVEAYKVLSNEGKRALYDMRYKLNAGNFL